jgi:hypothetical protein
MIIQNNSEEIISRKIFLFPINGKKKEKQREKEKRIK